MAKIKIIGLAVGQPTPADGEYVVEYDPSRPGRDANGEELLCHLVTTPDPNEALELPTKMEAFELWRSVDQRQPLRPDGRPNRPLTAYTVDIL